MEISLFKEIVSSIAGSNATKIVDLLYQKKNVNEFLIAKKLKLTINQTRNVLYKLSDEGLVSFIRKKDKKKGGWYTYFWTLNFGKSLHKFKDKLDLEITTKKASMNTKKNNQFYICPNCHIEYSTEQALLSQYACPECGEILGLKDNSQEIADLEKGINKAQAILNEVNAEISTVNKQDDKIKHRKLKAEAKKKQKERVERKKEKIRLGKKEQKARDKKSKSKKGKK